MIDLLLVATAALVLGAMARAWFVSGDPVHPMLFLGPMLLYIYAFRPWQILGHAGATDLLAGEEGTTLVLLVNAMGVAAFCFGVLGTLRRPARSDAVTLRHDVGPETRRLLGGLAVLLGSVAVLSYAYLIDSAGGLLAVYGQAKGYAHASSGYAGEAPNLAFPAILLLFTARAGERWRVRDFVLLAFLASPHLIHGTVGSRRGPLFLILATLFLGWFLTRRRGRSVLVPLLALLVIGASVLLVFSQRKRLYLSSTEAFEAEAFERVALAKSVDPGDTFFFSGASILTAESSGRNAFGATMFLTLLVRPIPRQIWPTKYEDVLRFASAGSPGSSFYSDAEWQEAVGWIPIPGSARGFVADFFAEFSWLGLVFCWLFGRLWAYFWWRARDVGGLSALLLVLLLSLSIYVPTQSVSAVLHRFLFMGVVLTLLWRAVLGPRRLPLPEAYAAEVP